MATQEDPNKAYPGPGPEFGRRMTNIPQDPLVPRNEQNPNGSASEGIPYDPNENIDQYEYQTGVNGNKNYDVNMGMSKGLMDTATMAGNSRYANNNYNVNAGQANATNRQVQQEELSQFQLDKMLASNSPLMRRAASQAMARSGGRGLMNSSIAVGNAQGEMIDRATPFAQQDASWYGKTAGDNMDATNKASLANADLNTRAGIAGMEAGAARDRLLLQGEVNSYGDLRKAMINIENREDTQDWTSQERLGQEAYNFEQNELNREWTSGENGKANNLKWMTAMLDSDVRRGISSNDSFAKMYGAIMSNPKMKAYEQQQAVRDMEATLRGQRENSAWVPGDYFYGFDPSSATWTNSVDGSPPAAGGGAGGGGGGGYGPAPGGGFGGGGGGGYGAPNPNGSYSATAATEQAYPSAAQGGDLAYNEIYDPSNPSGSNASAQMYGSKSNVAAGETTARMPAV